MKLITTILILFVCFVCKAQNCDKFKVGSWHIVYNQFYKKYAVMRIDSIAIGSGDEQEFLLKNGAGDYGVYGKGWMEAHCTECGDPNKSLFSNPCDAKEFLITYIRKLKEDNWK